jgi:hypothetical protein
MQINLGGAIRSRSRRCNKILDLYSVVLGARYTVGVSISMVPRWVVPCTAQRSPVRACTTDKFRLIGGGLKGQTRPLPIEHYRAVREQS